MIEFFVGVIEKENKEIKIHNIEYSPNTFHWQHYCDYVIVIDQIN